MESGWPLRLWELFLFIHVTFNVISGRMASSNNVCELIIPVGMNWQLESINFTLLYDQNVSFPSDYYFKNWAQRNKITILVCEYIFDAPQNWLVFEVLAVLPLKDGINPQGLMTLDRKVLTVAPV